MSSDEKLTPAGDRSIHMEKTPILKILLLI
jgi:hypothetical protein